MELLRHNFVINLRQRGDRLSHAQEEFKKLGLPCTRFEAIWMQNGAVGCTMSHIKCLEKAIERDYEQCFICEDDITFTDVSQMKESLIQFHNSTEPWDVLMIGGNLREKGTPARSYCARVNRALTTTGYVVKRHYYGTLLNNFKTSLGLLIKHNSPNVYALDRYWESLQHKDRWYILMPLTVTQYANYSDIENKSVDYTNVMLHERMNYELVKKDRPYTRMHKSKRGTRRHLREASKRKRGKQVFRYNIC